MGSDHPFHVDHMKQWHWAIEAFQEVANYNADVKISIEYTHMRCVIELFYLRWENTSFL